MRDPSPSSFSFLKVTNKHNKTKLLTPQENENPTNISFQPTHHNILKSNNKKEKGKILALPFCTKFE